MTARPTRSVFATENSPKCFSSRRAALPRSKISSRSDLKQRKPYVFWSRSPQQEQQQEEEQDE